MISALIMTVGGAAMPFTAMATVQVVETLSVRLTMLGPKNESTFTRQTEEELSFETSRLELYAIL